MSRQQLTLIEKTFKKLRKAYKAVLVLTGLVAIVLTVLEELSNVGKRRAKQDVLPMDATDREGTADREQAEADETT